MATSTDFVARIADGDSTAEADFVRQFERGVHALMRRHCRPGDPAVDDLVQDVLANVLERLRAGAIHDATALPAYVQSTIIHTASAEYRRRRPTQPIEAAVNIPSTENPGSVLAAEQLRDVLKRVLADLPVARDREILRRFYLEDQDRDVVCQALDIEASHFHRVVFRARERFRVLLEKAGIGEHR